MSALGLGIDVPDIQVVVHIGKPYSLVEYAQQSGRAERDGQRSEEHGCEYRPNIDRRPREQMYV